jgi:hypothetical protein
MKQIFILLIFMQFVFSQDSLLVRGVVDYAIDNTCMDQCSQYVVNADLGYESTYITILPNPSDLDEYVGEHVEIWGHMVDCFLCSALHVDNIEILDTQDTTVEGVLSFNNGWSFCMDGCDEFTLELDEEFNQLPIITETSISPCNDNPGLPEMEILVSGNEITFEWLNGELQCCIEPHWSGVLDESSATYYLEIQDQGPPCDCMCSFDQTVTIGDFAPGDYDLIVEYSNYNWTFFGGSFTIEDSIQLVEQTETDCLDNRDEPYIEVEVDGSYMTLNYFNAYQNCCPELVWDGWLNGNTFHTTLIDINPACWCECHFNLSATFGPFEDGTYTLDFLDGELGTPEFNIGESEREIMFVTTLGNPESIMEFNNERVIITGYETICAECSGLVPETIELVEEPNPCLLGDASFDNILNVLDIVIIVDCILTIDTCDECMDINTDGNINVLDIVQIINVILNGPETPEECLLEPDIGPCDGVCPRYYFDPNSQQCEVFFWGCCEGVVPFDTLESCAEMCE